METTRSEQKRQNGQFVSNYAIKPFRWDVWNKRKHPTVEVSDHYDDTATNKNNINNQHQKKSSKPQEEDTLQVVQQSIQPSSVIQNVTNVTESPVTETNNSIISERNGTNKSNSTRQSRNPQGAFLDSWDDYIEKERQTSMVSPKTTIASTPPPINTKALNETLTLGELEQILKSYVKATDLVLRGTTTSRTTTTTTPPNISMRRSSTVAFPQPSLLSFQNVKIGSSVSGSMIFALLLSVTVSSNLWLLGSIIGGFVGYEVSKNCETTTPTNTVANIIIAMGRRLAKAYLLIYDGINGIWFMYKTGQLSYEYYKSYSKLDQRFEITNKIDAWNARFQQGKKAFDKWERENEVGRKALAMMRTAWLVEEKSLKKERSKNFGKYSKYRVVQWYYNISDWVQRLVRSIWNAATGGGSSELTEVLKGIRINISKSALDEVGAKLGSALVALLTVYLVGSMFAIAPVLLGSIAIVSGMVWPSWMPELKNRGQDLIDDLRAQGRDESGGVKKSKRLLPPKKKSIKEGRFSWFRQGPKSRPPLQEQWGIFGEVARRNSSSKKSKSRKNR